MTSVCLKIIRFAFTEQRDLQAVHLCHLPGRLPVRVEDLSCGALHRRQVHGLYPLHPPGPLPVPLHAGHPAQVLLHLDPV